MKARNFTIIVLIVTLIGVFLSWTYQKPEIKTYTTLNDIDQTIEVAEAPLNISFVEFLNQFHATLVTIIDQAKTYDGQSVISFDDYNAQYASLHRFNNDLSNELERAKSLIGKLDPTSNGIIQMEQERFDQLNQLNTELESTVSYLQNFEEMIYTNKASDAKRYLQELDVHFSKIQELNNRFADLSKTYFEQKTELYNEIEKK